MSGTRKAFTIVELVVVLSVLAALTHLAVRELSHVRDSKLARAADRQLEVLGESVYSCTPGAEAAGFLADMGRLPRLADGATLGELWQMPTNARPYAVRAATAENLVPGLEHLADGAVHVPTGWRGPYLRLPPGASRLLDPWGNPVERTDDAGLVRLWTTNGFVHAVSHYGPGARAGGMRTHSLVPNGGAESRLFVSAVSADATFAGDISYTWYGPADGLITGAVRKVLYPASAVFEGLTPGRRILKDSRSGCARVIDLRPGDNLVAIQIP